jgi:hypothetical protein
VDPCQLFLRVYDGFARQGLLGRAVRLSETGRIYSVRCDRDCFTVYRVNDKPFLPPGLPGWTVCRLTRAECFSLPGQEQACNLPPEGEHLEEASKWVEMVLTLLDRRLDQPGEDKK